MKFDSKDLMLGIVTLIKFDGIGISKKRWTGRFHTRIKDGSPTVVLFLILPSFSQALASFMSKKYWGFSQVCCFASCFSPSFSDCTYLLSLLSIHLPTHLHLLKYSAQSLRASEPSRDYANSSTYYIYQPNANFSIF